MSEYNSYYLYKRFEIRGSQDAIPCVPAIYSVDGDGTMPLVLKTENDTQCGYIAYRWVDNGDNYICSGTSKYQEQIYQVSYDSINWENVEPEQTRIGDLIEANSTDCGYIEPQYRWVDIAITDDYVCSGYDKYYKQKKQVSNDGGITWTDVSPAEYQTGELYETDSTDCGYVCQTIFTGTSSVGNEVFNAYINWDNVSSTKISDGQWNVNYTDEITSLERLFISKPELTSVYATSCIDTSNCTTMGKMFQYCSGLTSLDISNFNTSNVDYMSYMFYDCINLTSLDISNFITSNVEYMQGMFIRCQSLTTLDLSNFNTLKVKDMQSMFDGCSGLTSLNVSSFNTSACTNMYDMFSRCSSLESLNVTNFNTSNVTDMSWMFFDCTGLTSLDITNFNTSACTKMNDMFQRCTSLTTLDLSNFNTSACTKMDYMFRNCSGLTTLDLSSFDTSNVTGMSNMFSECTSLTTLDLSSFDFSNITIEGDESSSMFYECTSLSTIYCSSANKSWIQAKIADTPSITQQITYIIK